MEVCLPFRPRAGVAGMTMGLVADRQSGRMQLRSELGMNAIGDVHDEGTVKVRGGTVKSLAQFCVAVAAATLVSCWRYAHTQAMPRASIEASAGTTAAAAATRLCDHPGCAGGGDFRAPRGRDRLDVFYWFCLDHVRAYNAQWNYYAGMTATEIEAEIRNDTVWQRPTWPLGSRVGLRFGPKLRDFGMFGFDEEEERPIKKRPPTEQEQALAVFDLALPLTFAGLKSRYKELVKLHHPDAHGGDKAAEERLKVINQAYSTLKTSYFPSG
jgi:hypothetical protein